MLTKLPTNLLDLKSCKFFVLLVSTFSYSQTLIADYGLGQSSLSYATGNFVNVSIGASATTNTVSTCTDDIRNNDITTPNLDLINRGSFQFDVTVNITNLPTNQNSPGNPSKHPILTFDGAYRDFGVNIDDAGYLYIMYNNSTYSVASVNTFSENIDYEIKVQYIKGSTKLMVNNTIEIVATIPYPLNGAASNLNRKIYLSENPGFAFTLAACFSNLKVYNSPVAFILPNNAPTIEAVLDQQACPNADVIITTAIADAETTAANLTVVATASNQAIVTNANIVKTNSGDDFTFTITSETDATCTVSIIVSATD